MSTDVHFSDAPDGTIPKRFLCGKKCKDGGEWTRDAEIVDCSRCRANLKRAAEMSESFVARDKA